MAFLGKTVCKMSGFGGRLRSLLESLDFVEGANPDPSASPSLIESWWEVASTAMTESCPSPSPSG